MAIPYVIKNYIACSRDILAYVYIDLLTADSFRICQIVGPWQNPGAFTHQYKMLSYR